MYVYCMYSDMYCAYVALVPAFNEKLDESLGPRLVHNMYMYSTRTCARAGISNFLTVY